MKKEKMSPGQTIIYKTHAIITLGYIFYNINYSTCTYFDRAYSIINLNEYIFNDIIRLKYLLFYFNIVRHISIYFIRLYCIFIQTNTL